MTVHWCPVNVPPQCIVTLWRSIESQLKLPIHSAAQEALLEDFTGEHLLGILNVLTSSSAVAPADVDVCGPVFEIASLLPVSTATGVSEVRLIDSCKLCRSPQI